MIRRVSPTLALLSLLRLPATAQAQDFAAEAERRMRLADQLPVSEMDEVKVKLEETTPADAAGEHDGPGIMHWTLALHPGQEQTVDLRFSGTAPADAAVAQRWAAEMF